MQGAISLIDCGVYFVLFGVIGWIHSLNNAINY
jgi:hypothetical protein